MGWWGVHSDENDDTYDVLGLGIGLRISGAGAKISDQERTKANRIFAQSAAKAGEALPGVVCWGLANGFKVGLTKLRQADRMLRKELAEKENVKGWRDFGARKRAIRSELKWIEHALANDGYGRPRRSQGILKNLVKALEASSVSKGRKRGLRPLKPRRYLKPKGKSS